MIYIIKTREGVEVARGLNEVEIKNFLEQMGFKGNIDVLFNSLTHPFKSPTHPAYCFYTITTEEE